MFICTSFMFGVSCCSKHKLIKQHNLELKELNDTLSKQTKLLDSLSTIPPKIDTVIKHTERIIDNTDSLVKLNNQMYNKILQIKFDTDTIKNIIRIN